ncbi:MAG: OmpA family protein [Bacteroidetes bacterium]|nr:MAG: OmpA family protein [Bacteroidota bacterium]
MKKLEDFREILRSSSVTIDSVQAFCDKDGTVQYNDTLAYSRVQSVMTFLDTNISNYSIKIIGERYIDPQNYLESDWRKVTIHFSKIESEIIEIKKNEYVSAFDTLTISTVKGSKTDPIVIQIEFVPGEDQFYNQQSLEELDRLFQFLKNNENIHSFIRGHVCCGSDYDLSHRRAYKVYEYLMKRGISPKRLEYKGFSNSIPLKSPEITDQDRQLNRRVDVIFHVL